MMQRLLSLSLPRLALILALMEAVYISLVVLFISEGVPFLFEEVTHIPEIVGVALMLLLLVISVAVSGIVVFGYPAYLAMKGEWRTALHLVAYTLGWMATLFVAGILLFIPFR